MLQCVARQSRWLYADRSGQGAEGACGSLSLWPWSLLALSGLYKLPRSSETLPVSGVTG